MGHCSTLMSLSKNKERALRSGTRFPEGSGQAVAFRIGGVSLGQCASVREECPERPGMSWIMISSKEAQSLVRTTPIPSNISRPQRLHGISATLEKRNLGCHLCPSSVPGGPQYGVLLSSHFTDGGAGSKDFQWGNPRASVSVMMAMSAPVSTSPFIASPSGHMVIMGECGKTGSVKNTLRVSSLSGRAEGCPI